MKKERLIPQYAMFGLPGGTEILFVLLFWLLPLLGIVWLVRYLMRSAEERRLTRLEISRLANEVEQLRKAHTGTLRTDQNPK